CVRDVWGSGFDYW
nr:immunoglobulin heavy chain junction region [Macaca mulatta]MOV35931.1 immunoglobulin heavy chain junction region [Macaca mulatta]MOV36192.1 immunoglobulin heavy chain junction region [Macaca mulatta]MOV36228.1 immunoglobulin heavy chain junction region [Macaca mulatta]MOV36241.1 immunoglobulin heavy chain junction region [Macaca mulatta]